MASTASRLGSFADRRPIAALVLAVLACEVVGASGSVFTLMGLESWYATLVRPDLAPPNWVFGPVWTTLFALIGVAAWLVWRRLPAASHREGQLAIATFVGQFVLNLAWSAVFFGARSLAGGLVVIGLLWLAIAATVYTFARVDRRAGALLLPYLAWVTFAGYLNYAFWALN